MLHLCVNFLFNFLKNKLIKMGVICGIVADLIGQTSLVINC